VLLVATGCVAAVSVAMEVLLLSDAGVTVVVVVVDIVLVEVDVGTVTVSVFDEVTESETNGTGDVVAIVGDTVVDCVDVEFD
jgi:hypothetical protein